MVDAITREDINYLVCEKCGVVFPDRNKPVSCPICSSSTESFKAYCSAPVSHDES